MPYCQDNIEILYPPIDASAWIVISRVNEIPDRIVDDLSQVDMMSEFALPIPTGSFPTKQITITTEHQEYDEAGRPVYTDDSPDGTTIDTNVDGDPYPPKTISEDIILEVNMLERPDLFSIQEIKAAVINDLLAFYRIYDWGQLILFDDRIDDVPTYEELSGASGLAAGSHPLFLGPIQGQFDAVRYTGSGDTPSPISETIGHLMLIAPDIQDVNWYYQMRHGEQGISGGSGPIADISQASRLGEIFTLTPMQNTLIVPNMVLDSIGKQTQHFWVRTGDMEEGGSFLNRNPAIPFIAILGRSNNKPTSGDLSTPTTYI